MLSLNILTDLAVEKVWAARVKHPPPPPSPTYLVPGCCVPDQCVMSLNTESKISYSMFVALMMRP
jgi:hypothetical protein